MAYALKALLQRICAHTLLFSEVVHDGAVLCGCRNPGWASRGWLVVVTGQQCWLYVAQRLAQSSELVRDRLSSCKRSAVK
jgi:hypothetical protein